MAAPPTTGPGFRNYIRIQWNGVELGVPCSVDKMNWRGNVLVTREGPVVRIELTRAITSRPYPIIVIEEMSFAQAEILRADFLYWPIEPLDILQAEILAADLREPIVEYSIPPEAMDIAQAELLAAEMRDPLKSYDIPFESMDIAQAELLDAAMRDALIRYTNWPAESMDFAQAELLGATLT